MCFPALETSCLFSGAWNRLLVFPRLEPIACFPALGPRFLFSRTSNHFLIFPHLEPVACFPALGTGCMSSRPSSWLHIPNLAPVASVLVLLMVACFPRAHVLWWLLLVACFPELGTGCLFSCALHISLFPNA